MRKSFLVLTTLIASLLLTSCSIIAKQQNVSQESAVREVDASWNEYTNRKLRFSLKIPKTTYRFVGFHRTPERVSIPVRVIEDRELNDVYITDAWTIDEEGKKLKDVTLEEVRNRNPAPWKIMIRNVAGKEDIRAFMKKRYYPGCELSEITPSKVEGLFDVDVTDSGPDASENEYCFINWITITKYSPERKLIANWDIGQDIAFAGPDQESYDIAMIDSFRFLK